MTGTNPTYKKAIYMIAIIPPEPIYSEVKEFQQHFADHYRSGEALRRPAHITLINPFTLSSDEEEKLKKFVLSFTKSQTPFELAFDGFDKFSNTTIFVAPIKNEHLQKLHKSLSTSFYKQFPTVERGPSYGFHPHMTIGFKDLKPDMHALAWRKFSDTLYRRRFILDSIYLMRHNGKEWVTIEKGLFGSSAENGQLTFL
jgi:2'-5' RNA ligase